jgi:hypothetical protein
MSEVDPNALVETEIIGYEVKGMGIYRRKYPILQLKNPQLIRDPQARAQPPGD